MTNIDETLKAIGDLPDDTDILVRHTFNRSEDGIATTAPSESKWDVADLKRLATAFKDAKAVLAHYADEQYWICEEVGCLAYKCGHPEAVYRDDPFVIANGYDKAAEFLAKLENENEKS